MLDERRLIDRLRQGDREALRQIYVTYKDGLLTLGFSLLHDMHAAEDTLHDVFVSFAGSASRLELRTSLRAYLTASVVNRVRDRFRRQNKDGIRATDMESPGRISASPEDAAILNDEARRITAALARLPLEQREVITLRLNAGMKLKEIAEIQETSIPTVQGRYRYGMDKLRTLLAGGCEE